MYATWSIEQQLHTHTLILSNGKLSTYPCTRIDNDSYVATLPGLFNEDIIHGLRTLSVLPTADDVPRVQN